jgi:fatty acid desaturase
LKTLAAITDPVFTPGRNYSSLDRFFISLLNDERDLPFVYLTLRITLTVVPLGVLLYLPFVSGWVWWAIAAVYFYLNNLYFKGPFGLMLHCTSHRRYFNEKYNWLNHYLPWVISPFFGQSPETYQAHHIGMHHAENNLEEDESSTMYYQRDSFREFLQYFSIFFTTGIYTLYKYHIKKKRPVFVKKLVRGEIAFILLCVGLSFVNFPATFIVFIFPFILFRFVAMIGNWSQHIFINLEDPANLYGSSITCINHKYNHKCWNDGYHISHHILPNMHWTEHPRHFQENLNEYVKNKAFVFDGLDFLGVFLLVMKKRYDKLADHLVNINGMFSSREEAIALMKERTSRIPRPEATFSAV